MEIVLQEIPVRDLTRRAVVVLAVALLAGCGHGNRSSDVQDWWDHDGGRGAVAGLEWAVGLFDPATDSPRVLTANCGLLSREIDDARSVPPPPGDAGEAWLDALDSFDEVVEACGDRQAMSTAWSDAANSLRMVTP